MSQTSSPEIAGSTYNHPPLPASIEAGAQYRVIRREGNVTPFDPGKITVAMAKAFLAVEGQDAKDSARIHEITGNLTIDVVNALTRRANENAPFHIEDIQDQVELALMRGGHHKVARAYVLYREEHNREHAAALEAKAAQAAAKPVVNVTMPDGAVQPLDEGRLSAVVAEAVEGLTDVDGGRILTEIDRNLYDGITESELELAAVLAARSLVEQEPDYSRATARLLLDKLRREALSHVFGELRQCTQAQMADTYPAYFRAYLNENFVALQEEGGFTAAEIVTLVANGFEAAWLPDARKSEYRDLLDKAAAGSVDA